jgi:hypothetical protein
MSLKLQILSGTFLVNLDTFKDQDPYACFHHKGHFYKTKILLNWGKKAKWDDEEWTLSPLHYHTMIVLEAWDYDAIGSDDCIGKSKPIWARDYATKKGPQPIEIYYKGKHTGELVFQMKVLEGEIEVDPKKFFEKEKSKMEGSPEV